MKKKSGTTAVATAKATATATPSGIWQNGLNYAAQINFGYLFPNRNILNECMRIMCTATQNNVECHANNGCAFTQMSCQLTFKLTINIEKKITFHKRIPINFHYIVCHCLVCLCARTRKLILITFFQVHIIWPRNSTPNGID